LFKVNQYSQKGSSVFLQTTINNTAYLNRALFFGFYSKDRVQWWWLQDVDAENLSWKLLGESVDPYSFPPGELDSGLRESGDEGKRIVFVGGSSGVMVYLR
jgi:hypothetical protein